MDALTLFPQSSSLCVNAWHWAKRGLRLDLSVIASGANCPLCGQLSNRVHNRYRRTLADLPCSGLAVSLEVQARKFFCGNVRCHRRIFTNGSIARAGVTAVPTHPPHLSLPSQVAGNTNPLLAPLIPAAPAESHPNPQFLPARPKFEA